MPPLDLNVLTWRKSSHSNGDGGLCVEVAEAVSGSVPVRDSKDVRRGVLTVPVPSWAGLVAALRR